MAEGAAAAPDEQALIEIALRPFRVLEALGLPSQYERSFKLQPGELLAQRYMLGVRADQASPAQWLDVAQGLGMPEALRFDFASALDGAQSALFGFEGAERGAVLKAYAEYRGPAELARSGAPTEPVATEPVVLFRGFKWRADCPDPGVQTIYRCRPGLPVDAVQACIARLLAASSATPVRTAVGAILERALQARPGFEPQWLELGESGQPVRAFDLNLYASGLRVDAIGPELLQLAAAFNIDRQLMPRLLDAAGAGLLGHLSAGLSRDQGSYLTIYFEP